jgi:hypothetical protein
MERLGIIRHPFHCFFLSSRVSNLDNSISPIKALSNETGFAESGINGASNHTNEVGNSAQGFRDSPSCFKILQLFCSTHPNFKPVICLLNDILTVSKNYQMG